MKEKNDSKKLFKLHMRLRAPFKTPSVQYVFAAQEAPYRTLVVSNRSGDYQLHAVNFMTGFHRQVTKKKNGALFGSLSPGGERIYFLDDTEGDEQGHFIQTRFTKDVPFNITPDNEPYFSYSIQSNADGRVLYFTASLEDKNRLFAARGNQDGRRSVEETYATGASLSEPVCSLDGTMVCVAETNPETGGNSQLILFQKEGTEAQRSKRFDTILPLSFSNAPMPIVLALARIGDWLRPVLYDFTRGNTSEIQHPSFRGDVWVLSWDEARDRMILCDMYHAEQKLYLYDTRTCRIRRIGPRTGSFNFHFNAVATRPDDSLILRWSNFNTSPRLIRLNAPRYDTWEELPEWSGHEVSNHEIKNVWTRSSDGKRVQLWIARPKNTKRPLPFVIEAHGGPHSVIGDEYSPEAQAWLVNGFGYCAINYHGSLGFGKDFEKKIYGDPGYWEVEDVVAARTLLVQNGYAEEKKITLYGWSWGGYATLLALGKYPSLWQCGIAGSAITDCVMQYEDEPAYFKAEDRERFGGTPETQRAQYVRSSPSTYRKRIQAPILILHGENDTRCPPRQIKYFIDALRKDSKLVSVEWFASGHTGEFTNTALRIKLIDKAIRFALDTQKTTPPERM